MTVILRNVFAWSGHYGYKPFHCPVIDCKKRYTSNSVKCPKLTSGKVHSQGRLSDIVFDERDIYNGEETPNNFINMLNKQGFKDKYEMSKEGSSLVFDFGSQFSSKSWSKKIAYLVDDKISPNSGYNYSHFGRPGYIFGTDATCFKDERELYYTYMVGTNNKSFKVFSDKEECISEARANPVGMKAYYKLSGLGIEKIPISISAASSSTSLSSSSKIQKPINNLSSHNYNPGAKLKQKLEKFLTELSSEDIKEPANKKPRPSSN